MSDLLISVITASLNQGAFIEENIISVMNQSYSNYQHIVIDGGSVDGTIRILKKYNHLKWISEKDAGQSDAYNKGLKLAEGQLILYLNADDYLLNEDVFENVVKQIKQLQFENYSAFIGNIEVVDSSKLKINEMKNRNQVYDHQKLLNKLPVVIHPGTFFVKTCLEKTTGYSRDIHYVMDYDICLKVSKILPMYSIPVFVAALRRHDSSKGCGNSNWKFASEFIKLRVRNNGEIFNKINLQPLKTVAGHILGEKIVYYLKKKGILNWLLRKIGVSKLKSLTWYE